MTPLQDKLYFPAEWNLHESTWLSFPHNKETWEGGHLIKMLPSYLQFIKLLSQSERVNIISSNKEHELHILDQLKLVDGVNLSNIKIYPWGTNDSWCRDHGPSFVISKRNKGSRAIINWGYNSWGEKYPPYDLDNEVPQKVAQHLLLKLYEPGIIMEGGSIEVNGIGDLITSKSCLLNKNRNPSLDQNEIEEKLKSFYNIKKVHWLEQGIAGDDTDGHVDDMVRFVNSHTIVACIEDNIQDENYQPLQSNWEVLEQIVLSDGTKPKLIPLPMPDPVCQKGIRLPASYANFYICNKYVIVPTYNCLNDEIALATLQSLFPIRKVVGIDSTEVIWGLGSFHCLSQQEPKS